MDRYRRTFTELESVAIKFWPSELSEREAQISIIPLLLKSQDRFIGILSACEQDIDSIFATIEGSRMPANLFLKHLVVLSDFSAEMMKRTSREFSSLFPKKILNYSQNKTPKLYEFREVPNTKLPMIAYTLMGFICLKSSIRRFKKRCYRLIDVWKSTPNHYK